MNIFEINFNLMQIQNQSLYDIESMIPWERDVYVEQLRQYLEEQKLKALQAKADAQSLRYR